MGIIVKGYNTTIISGTTIFPSDTIAAFDTIYDVVNGGLDAANIGGSFDVEASAITITETATYFTATRVNLIHPELTKKGWNSIHVLGAGSNGLSVFPGIIEINGKYCRVNSRIDFCGTGEITVVASNSSRLWGLVIGQAALITKSDIRLIEYSTTLTFAFDHNKNGFYETSGSRRAICVIRADITGTGNDSFYDHQYLQRPSVGHRYQLTANEKSALSFIASGANSLDNVVRVLDMDTLLFSYELTGQFGGNSNTTNDIWVDSATVNKHLLGTPFFGGPGNVGKDSSFFTHYYIQYVQAMRGNPPSSDRVHAASRRIRNLSDVNLANITFIGNGTVNDFSSVLRTHPMDVNYVSGTYTILIKKRIDQHSRVG